MNDVDKFSSDEVPAEPSDGKFVPDNVVGPFLPVSQHDINFFNDLIAQEVDSAYTSSICCCDACYDDFQRYWPGVAFREMEFQTQSMSLFWFIEYSRIVDCYTPTELSTLRHFVECPRCHENIAGNMWLYEHRFSDAEELEEAIEELTGLGRRTPFLILEHKLAKQLLEAIRQHASTVSAAPLPDLLYRARAAGSMVELGQLPSEIQSYGAAPPEYVTEGRFNHAGSPMIYLANTASTALREIGEPDKDFNVAALAIDQPLKVFDLVNIDEEISSYELFAVCRQLRSARSAPYRQGLAEAAICLFALRSRLRKVSRLRRYSIWVDKGSFGLELRVAGTQRKRRPARKLGGSTLELQIGLRLLQS